MAVRKLLVASQKGGVGKTTTSINLAAGTALAGSRVLLLDADPLSSISTSLNLAVHPNRHPLRAAGLDLPGVLVSNVVPGLDVLSPYEEGGCSDENLDDLLSLLSQPVFQKAYGCLIVDTPPFLGAKPAQLLAISDQFILVMRAEPMAYRTLPAFLELVQRSRKGGHDIQMRGILLTLPDGEAPGGRWERELRGRFGTRILPQVIPHDEEVAKALVFGQIVTQSAPETLAAEQYHRLVESLNLAMETRVQDEARNPLAPLVAAAAALKAAGTPGASSRRVPVVPPIRAVPQPKAPVPDKPAEEDVTPDLWLEAEETEAPSLHIAPPTAPTRLLSAADLPVLSPDHDPRLPGRLSVPMPTQRPGKAARGPGQRPARAPVGADIPDPTGRPANPVANDQRRLTLVLLWVGVFAAILVGIVLQRMPELLAPIVPVLIGLGVAGVVMILMKALGSSTEASNVSKPAAAAGDKPAPARPAMPRKGAESKASASPARKDPGSRLNSIPRRQPGTPHRRDPHGR